MCRFIATSIYVKSSHNHDILPAPLQQKHPPTHPPTLIPNLHLHEVQSNCLAYFIWITTNNISTDGFGTLPYKYGTLNLRPPTLKHEKASHVFHRANQNQTHIQHLAQHWLGNCELHIHTFKLRIRQCASPCQPRATYSTRPYIRGHPCRFYTCLFLCLWLFVFMYYVVFNGTPKHIRQHSIPFPSPPLK